MLFNVSTFELVDFMNAFDLEELITVAQTRLRMLQAHDRETLNEDEIAFVAKWQIVAAVVALKRRTGMSLYDAKRKIDSYRNELSQLALEQAPVK